jgi:hypothetical protein
MVKEFKGHCKGIRLTKRSVNDNHICIQIITEDDDNWFASANPFSSHWINELIEQLEITKAYLETQDPDITEGIQYGWKFVNDTF